MTGVHRDMLGGELSTARPLRALLVVDSLDIGGAERHVVDLAVALQRRGHAVTVAASSGGPYRAELEREGVPVRLLPAGRVKRRVSLRYAARLWALVGELRPDLVHAHVYASSVAAALATAGTSTPLVVTVHTEGSWQGPISRGISRRVHRRAARVIAVSDAIRRHLVEEERVQPERVYTIHGAVTPHTPSAGETIALPAGWGTGPLVGVVARLRPEKGVQYFLEAVARVAPRVPEARFLVVGDGPGRRELEGQARRLGIERVVHFWGAHPNARALMPALDLLVIPSLSEGGPLVLLEAMAAGVPVVATPVGNIPRHVEPEREGLLVPVRDAEALAAAMLRMLRSPEEARRMAERARERLTTGDGFDTMVRAVERCYSGALGVVAAPTSGECVLRPVCGHPRDVHVPECAGSTKP